MIIILGPDHSGKTTLVKKLNLPHYHFTKESTYEDYLAPLCGLGFFDAVLDRHMICEYPYSLALGRKFQFTMKQWHNIILLTLAQNPLVVLCTRKPPPNDYPADQYLPYAEWDECLRLYREFLNTHLIQHIDYDYLDRTQAFIKSLLTMEAIHKERVSWWPPMWKAGYGFMGSASPKVLLVAERIDPNNMNNLPFNTVFGNCSHKHYLLNNMNSLPFETGPTGKMLTDMLTATGTPLGKFAVTNMVKSFRRDTRPPNETDQSLLRIELEHLKPEKVVFMGAVAKYGIKVAKELNIPHVEIPHLGSLHHKGVTDMSGYHAQWRKIMGMIPTLTLGGKGNE
ncbi:hypothetical protein ES703_72368 [subsurface metagenome]